MSAIYRTASSPGPAGRWFIDRIKQTGAQQAQQPLLRSAAQIGPPRTAPAFSRPLVSEAMQIRIG